MSYEIQCHIEAGGVLAKATAGPRWFIGPERIVQTVDFCGRIERESHSRLYVRRGKLKQVRRPHQLI